MNGLFDEYNEELKKAWGGLVKSMNAVPFTMTTSMITQRYFYDNLIPVRITYSPPATICYFPDGDKIVVKCASDEKYIKEVGVQACIMKKLFGSRHHFLKLVHAGYDQPTKESKQEITAEHVQKIINRIEQISD